MQLKMLLKLLLKLMMNVNKLKLKLLNLKLLLQLKKKRKSLLMVSNLLHLLLAPMKKKEKKIHLEWQKIKKAKNINL